MVILTDAMTTLWPSLPYFVNWDVGSAQVDASQTIVPRTYPQESTR